MASQYLTPGLIRRLGNLNLVARLVVDGVLAGQHKSPFFGFNIEFAEHRQYMPGDDLKHLDWKVWARRDKLYVKQYEESTSLRSMILLDVSRSMEFAGDPRAPGSPGAPGTGASPAALDPGEPEPAHLTKIEYAKCLTAALSYLMLSQKDSVGLLTYSDRIDTFVHPRSSPGHLHLVLEALGTAGAAGKTAVGEAIKKVAFQLKRRAMIVFISDFMGDVEELMKGVTYLKFLKHEPVLFHVLTPDELELPYEKPAEFVDLEDESRLILEPKVLREEYKRKLKEFTDRIQLESGYHKIDYHLFSTADPLEWSLSRYLMKRSRM